MANIVDEVTKRIEQTRAGIAQREADLDSVKQQAQAAIGQLQGELAAMSKTLIDYEGFLKMISDPDIPLVDKEPPPAAPG